TDARRNCSLMYSLSSSLTVCPAFRAEAIELEFLGHHLHGSIVTASANKHGEPLSVARQLGQPRQAFGLHRSATPTECSPATRTATPGVRSSPLRNASGVARMALHRCGRDQSRKAENVTQVSRNVHRLIVTSFQRRKSTFSA